VALSDLRRTMCRDRTAVRRGNSSPTRPHSSSSPPCPPAPPRRAFAQAGARRRTRSWRDVGGSRLV